jgi:predicted TIM-barrel fold metal-dependent hydrolase
MELGYDGIGEMGSKPAIRDVHVPLDSPYYRGFWEACEEHRFPVLCHIGDVEDFWHEETTPGWAKERGWGYYRGDYPSLEELYAEIESVLDRHPELPIALCHFLFLSPRLERAEELLETYPNACLDLSLGVELMYNISRRRDDYREFFTRHDTRILFGTDIGMSTTLPQHTARITMIRRFLETGDEFHTPDAADDLLTRYELPYVGLDLPRSSLERIYADNFRRLWGDKPRKVDVDLALATCMREGGTLMAEAFKGLRE